MAVMLSEPLTVGELMEQIEDMPDDETVWVSRGGAIGEATSVSRTADGVSIRGR